MNSFLLIDKEAGQSSFDVIRKLRRLLKIKKIGHAGTLDPFATGLLICATGQYTRLLKYAEAQTKSYSATMLLGKKSSTGDPEGEIIATGSCEIDEIRLSNLKEEIMAIDKLRIPIYSAVKIQGERAYKLAREGKTPEMPIRSVQIYDFEISMGQKPDLLDYSVQVSKGTYIRALSEYIAELLGTVGMTTELRRTAIGKINVERAICTEALAEDWRPAICPVHEILKLEGLILSPREAEYLQHGRKIELESRIQTDKELALYDQQQRLIGIGKVDQGILVPELVFDPQRAV